MQSDYSFSATAGALMFAVLVLCAWAYPRLNGWVYRRRVAREAADEADAARRD